MLKESTSVREPLTNAPSLLHAAKTEANATIIAIRFISKYIIGVFVRKPCQITIQLIFLNFNAAGCVRSIGFDVKE